jgi:hypothetical protein
VFEIGIGRSVVLLLKKIKVIVDLVDVKSSRQTLKV